MKKLLQGILDFRRNVLPHRREVFAKLALGQRPDVLFITCSDSRIAPNWFASTDPGDLFVIRNVGNLVPPLIQNGTDVSDQSVAAAIEFSLVNLKINHIVVCGHSGCGAMQALNHGLDKITSSHLRTWLRHTEDAVKYAATHKLVGDGLCTEDKLAQCNVLQQIENLKTYAIVADRIKNGGLQLHAWWFNIGEAGIYVHTSRTGKFELIDEEIAAPFLEKY